MADARAQMLRVGGDGGQRLGGGPEQQVVDDRGESFGFLGFDFRRIAVCEAYGVPTTRPSSQALKKRTALLRKLKDVFRRHQSQPIDRGVSLINPVIRGWVNYVAVGHAVSASAS